VTNHQSEYSAVMEEKEVRHRPSPTAKATKGHVRIEKRAPTFTYSSGESEFAC
jgi:hypothetical protein